MAVAAALALTGAALAADTPEPTRPATAAQATRTALTTVVAGIVSYTRWPSETTPIRFCTLGHGQAVDELLVAADLGSTQLRVPTHAAGTTADAPKECDVIYIGALAASVTRDVLLHTAGRPVLMIGEGADFCSDGGMFCVLPGAAAVSFTVNLDAVARSGLRVNPWVLRIARNANGSAR